MKINREDVVQAALTVERWCKEHLKDAGECDCPFNDSEKTGGRFYLKNCVLIRPEMWGLEEFLRTRGAKHDD